MRDIARAAGLTEGTLYHYFAVQGSADRRGVSLVGLPCRRRSRRDAASGRCRCESGCSASEAEFLATLWRRPDWTRVVMREALRSPLEPRPRARSGTPLVSLAAERTRALAAALRDEMAAGRIRKCDPRLVAGLLFQALIGHFVAQAAAGSNPPRRPGGDPFLVHLVDTIARISSAARRSSTRTTSPPERGACAERVARSRARPSPCSLLGGGAALVRRARLQEPGADRAERTPENFDPRRLPRSRRSPRVQARAPGRGRIAGTSTRRTSGTAAGACSTSRSRRAGAAGLRPGSGEHRHPAGPGRATGSCSRASRSRRRSCCSIAPWQGLAWLLRDSLLARPEVRAVARRRRPACSSGTCATRARPVLLGTLGPGRNGHAPQLLCRRTLRAPGGEQARLPRPPVRDPRSRRPGASGRGRPLVPARAGDRVRASSPSARATTCTVPRTCAAIAPIFPTASAARSFSTSPTSRSPREVGRLRPDASLGSVQGVHTFLPIPERRIGIINSEAHDEDCEPDPGRPYAAVVDLADESQPAHPLLLSGAGARRRARPTRASASAAAAPGPHNQHHDNGLPHLFHSDHLVYIAHFNAGLRLYDTSDPQHVREVGYFMPPDPERRFGVFPTRLVAQTRRRDRRRAGLRLLHRQEPGTLRGPCEDTMNALHVATRANPGRPAAASARSGSRSRPSA